MTNCEDKPCCIHGTEPCDPQWYDMPGAFDTSIRGNEHALCEHEVGLCDVYDYDEDECDPRNDYCAEDNDDCENCADYWFGFHADGMADDYAMDPFIQEDAAMESHLFGDC